VPALYARVTLNQMRDEAPGRQEQAGKMAFGQVRHRTHKWMAAARRAYWLCLAVGFCLFSASVLAQLPAPQLSPSPPPPASAASPEPAPAAPLTSGRPEPVPDQHAEPGLAATKPETKITAQQAQELFRSVDKILKFVSNDTGLPIKHRVKRRLAGRAQVESYIASRLQGDEEAKRLEHSSVVLKKFGLVPQDFNLRQFLIALLREQVAGYYDARTKTVYLLDWVEPDDQKPVLAHELTHALQDQNFGLERLSKSAARKDPTGLQTDERLAAREAVVEGQAMIVSMDYLLAPEGTSVARHPEMVEAMQPGLNGNAPEMDVFSRAPIFMKQVLLFPYQYGALFERDVLTAEGKQKAFAGTLKHPPEDTRQIMKPNTYMEGRIVPPLEPLAFDRLAPGYQLWDLSLMGEFDVYLLLEQYATPEIANDLSQMWRGGYYWAAKTPSAPGDDQELTTRSLAVAYVSRWFNADAAAEFAGIFADNVLKRYPGAQQTEGTVSPKLEEVPGTGIQVKVPPRLSGPVIWQTSEGQVSIETRGNTVLVMESINRQTENAIREAVFR